MINTRTVVIVVGVIAGLKLNFGGEIYVGELASLVYFALVVMKGKVNRFFLILGMGALAWSIFQLFSDLYNQSTVANTLKGVLAPLIFYSTIFCIGSVLGTRKRFIPYFLLGLIFSDLLQLIFSPTLYAEGNHWKWGGGKIALDLFLVYFSFFLRRKRSLYPILFLSFFSFVSIVYFEARSLSLIPIAGYLLYELFRRGLGRKVIKYFSGKFSALKFISILLVFGFVGNAAVQIIFDNGILDNLLAADTLQKYKVQASSEAGLLLAGRSESLVSLQAFFDAPILGHGSWAEDRNGYLSRYYDQRYKLGITDRTNEFEDSESNLIPTHSHIFAAMVWSGFMGGVFWVGLIAWLLSSYIKNAVSLPAYFHVGFVNIIWNIFLSPFGAANRWATAVFVAILFAFICELRGRKS